MTNKEKQQLRWMAKQGMRFADIKCVVGSADSTIKRYIKLFSRATQSKSHKKKGGCMPIIHFGRKAPKWAKELPGAMHLGRGIWAIPIQILDQEQYEKYIKTLTRRQPPRAAKSKKSEEL